MKDNHKPHKVVVIGTGIAGIASSIRLAAKGYQVEVFEKNNFPGGKFSQLKTDAYRFDMGPSLFTLPELLAELYELCGESIEDYTEIKKVGLICKYFFADGTIINGYQNIEKFAQEVASKTRVSPHKLKCFLKRSAIIYSLSKNLFIFKSFHRIETFLTKDFLRGLLNWRKLDPFRNMHKANFSFFKDKNITQLFDRFATYNGSSPYKAPATLNVIPHLEHNLGAYFPGKGMFSIISGLLKLAEKTGVKFHYNAEVTKIKIQHKKAKGIMVNNNFIKADLVISNSDIVKTYEILDGFSIPKKYLKEDRSTSAIIYFWGMKKQFPELQLHNVFFSDNYKKEFDCIFKEKAIYDHPTIYVFISSKYVKTDAPVYGENWYVMINCSENSGQDWESITMHFRAYILEILGEKLNCKLEDYIEFEKIITPDDIESVTHSYLGSLYGASSNSMFAAFNRHANFSSSIKNMYFVGGSVHPGGGIPLCLASAKIALEKIPAL